MSGWDTEPKGGGGGENFIKLKDGDAVEGCFVGEPYVFYQAFKEKEEYSSWSEGRSFKFRVNFIIKTDKGYTAKIYQGGSTVFKAIKNCFEEYSPNCIFKIKRTGSTKDDTTYSVLFKKELTKEQLETIKTVPLLPLTKQKKDTEIAQEVLGGKEVDDIDEDQLPF